MPSRYLRITHSAPLVTFFFLLITSCSTPTPSATSLPPVVPIDTPQAEVASLTPIPPTHTPSPTPTPAPERAQYSLEVLLDYAEKAVSVSQRIVYPNHSGTALPSLVLAVVPNLWPGGFALSALSVDGITVDSYTLVGQALEIHLPQPLQPEMTATVDMQYTLYLPFIEPNNPSQDRPRIYGYTARQVNLTNWYPFIVPVNSVGEWMLHDSWYYGEHLVYDAIDLAIDFRTDPGVVVAASGSPELNGESTRYALKAGRSFAISASTDFKVLSTQVGDVTVSSYYFPLYEVPGKAVLDSSAEAIQVYSDLFGPYPHKTLSAVMGDFNDGMEYSAFYFHSRSIYNTYNSTPQSLLVAVAVHETAHQWWFEKVANDQAVEPWLDEALCAYSERIFYGVKYPDLVSWWWQYWPGRVGGTDAWDAVDITVYQGGGFISYTNTVYLRGAHFLEDLRKRIGDEAFFAFLHDYADTYAGRIATSADFFATLRKHTDADISDLMQNYFENPIR